MTNTYFWFVSYGRTMREIADDYIASGKAVRRKDGKWDRRYRASRFVERVELGKTSLFASTISHLSHGRVS